MPSAPPVRNLRPRAAALARLLARADAAVRTRTATRDAWRAVLAASPDSMVEVAGRGLARAEARLSDARLARRLLTRAHAHTAREAGGLTA